MNDKDVIKIQNTIIKLQEQIINELLYNFVNATDEELKYIVRKINIAAELRYDITK